MLEALLALAAHHHADWLEWPGWDFIGTCAEVLALATLVIAAVGWFRTRHLYPPVIFEVGVPYLLGDGAGQVGYRVRVTNVGRSTAHIRSVYLVGAKGLDDVASPQIKWLVPSADHFEFDVLSDAIDEAWLLIVNSSFEDNQMLRSAWYPLREGTDLALKHQQSYVRTRMRRGLRGAWQRRHPKAVGPGKDAVTYVIMPRNKIQPMPEAIIAVINDYDYVELRRSGTVQVGDPKTWPKVPVPE